MKEPMLLPSSLFYSCLKKATVRALTGFWIFIVCVDDIALFLNVEEPISFFKSAFVLLSLPFSFLVFEYRALPCKRSDPNAPIYASLLLDFFSRNVFLRKAFAFCLMNCSSRSSITGNIVSTIAWFFSNSSSMSSWSACGTWFPYISNLMIPQLWVSAVTRGFQSFSFSYEMRQLRTEMCLRSVFYAAL